MNKKQVLVSCLLIISLIFTSCTGDTPKTESVLKNLSERPERMTYQESEEDDAKQRKISAWHEDMRKRSDASLRHSAKLKPFYAQTLKKALTAEKGENIILSPINIYIATAMLAEYTEGTTRAELLRILGFEKISDLRACVRDTWNANYELFEQHKSILSNSVWLNHTLSVKKDVLDILSKEYYADSFIGDPQDAAYTEELRNWINRATEGLLKKYTDRIEIHPQMLIRLISTIYYKTAWKNAFDAEETKKEIFRGTESDREVEMMQNSHPFTQYKSEHWKAVEIPLGGENVCYFILPNEAYHLNTVLEEAEDSALSFLNLLDDEKSRKMITNPTSLCKIPKFDLDSKIDLKKLLESLGALEVTASFGADFGALTDSPNVAISNAEHAARVMFDEQGITGAAYSTYEISMTAFITASENEFIVDRPFLFLIVGRDRNILFCGSVRNIP
ncbi:MAG: serpin family protein [Bacillota bacterium]|nr:serpin family protein [Bacillota bacterium]